MRARTRPQRSEDSGWRSLASASRFAVDKRLVYIYTLECIFMQQQIRGVPRCFCRP